MQQEIILSPAQLGLGKQTPLGRDICIVCLFILTRALLVTNLFCSVVLK